MRNWKQVEIPPKMQHLKRDKRGYPIPSIILIDKDGQPNFIVNNDVEVMRHLAEKRCHVCGLQLHDDMWMIGGPKSAFNPRGAFIDGPVHKECGEYALQVCPYLAVSNYKGKQTMDDIDAGKFDVPEGRVLAFVNPTQDQNRVPFFAFVKVGSYKVRLREPVTKIVVPEKPYLEEEFWNDGVRIPNDNPDVVRIVEESKTDQQQTVKMFVLYDHPSDFPKEYVVRELHIVGAPGETPKVSHQDVYVRNESLAFVTDKMSGMGMSWIPRDAGDDRVIMGTWM